MRVVQVNSNDFFLSWELEVPSSEVALVLNSVEAVSFLVSSRGWLKLIFY